eukprot:2305128-Karenia_brevis.AAC.1
MQSRERANISKLIKKELRRSRRKIQDERIEHLIEEFKGLRKITHIKLGRKKTLISSMMNSRNVKCTDRASIANVFADFYEELYKARV